MAITASIRLRSGSKVNSGGRRKTPGVVLVVDPAQFVPLSRQRTKASAVPVSY